MPAPRRTVFIHAADLHLGSPLAGLRSADPHLAQRLSSALALAFERLVDQAVSRDVDFLVIAGDVFDSPDPGYADMMLFVDGMRTLERAGIPVFLATGNHERSQVWEQGLSALPGNVVLFGDADPAIAVAERGGVPLAAVVGRGFDPAEPVETFPWMTADAVLRECGDAPFAVGVLHTGLDIDRSVAPVSPRRLEEAGLDYWALGHIHNRCCDDPADPRIVFSGCIQGRGFHEPGDCGCNLVTLCEGEPNRMEFVPLSSVAWEQVEADVSSCRDVADVEDRVVRALRSCARSLESDMLCARVVLVGESRLQELLARPDVLEDLRCRANGASQAFACDSVSSRVRLPFDREAAYDQGLFPAALLSSADALRADPAGLRGIVEEALAERGLALPDLDGPALADLCDGAEDLLLGLLSGGLHG